MRFGCGDVCNYVLDRLNESSTWRGLVLVLSTTGAWFKPQWSEVLILLGVGLAGVLGVILKDKPKE